MGDFIDSRMFGRGDASNLTEVQLTGLSENGSQRRLRGRPIRKLCERGANLEVLHLGDFKLSDWSMSVWQNIASLPKLKKLCFVGIEDANAPSEPNQEQFLNQLFDR